MLIVCPHCTTSYAVDPAALGPRGRTVRCARCKETWVAHAPAAEAVSGGPAGPAIADRPPAEAVAAVAPEPAATDVPEVESPSIAGDWPAHDGQTIEGVVSAGDAGRRDPAPQPNRFRRTRQVPGRRPRRRAGLALICLGMVLVIAALVVRRADVVRLLPQTARFYSLVGMTVNLRGLAIEDVKLSTETAEGKPVLVIEGRITNITRRASELPRLRFVVRDSRNNEIYAWNTVLEQAVLKPGEKVAFRSRLASPPAEARSVDVRFFNKNDLAAGGA